jgi:hypothetical protein
MAEHSADESSDEPEPAEMEEQEESESEAQGCHGMEQVQTRGAGDVLAKFLDVTRQFTATLEDMRKQELMQSRGSQPRKSLAFDDLRPPSRSRPQQFTPPRKARDMIAASPGYYEFEADSMTSQSSRTARTRLQEKFVVVGTKLLAENTPDQSIHASRSMQELAISGGVDDRHTKETDLGGFKQTNVGFDFNLRSVVLSSSLTVTVQVYRSPTDKPSSFTRKNYHCPYRFLCGCYVAIAVKHYKDKVVLLQSGAHSADSHGQSRGILNPKQRGAIVRAVKSAPMSVGSQVQSNLQNFSPGKHVPFDDRSRGALNRLVRRGQPV